MNKNEFTQLLVEESFRINEINQTIEAKNLSDTRKKLLDGLKTFGKSNNTKLLVELEKQILQIDLTHHANSTAMKGSLKTAINELDIILRHLKVIENPEAYKAVDEAYRLPKNRQNGLPVDEARQAFKSHFARLVNLDKSRLNDEEKRIIDVRKANINVAKKLYIEKQQQVLGITQANTRQRKQ